MAEKTQKKKRPAILFKLVSAAGTGYCYFARRNPKKRAEKMKFTKYDPVAKKHVLFEEQKLS
jgi:large subunit ribosomal protein L33